MQLNDKHITRSEMVSLSSFHKRIFLLCELFIFLLWFTTATAQNINHPNKTGPMGLEVNTWSGNVYLSRTDVYIPARQLDFNISFSYNSYSSDENTGYGNGWTFIYNMRYRIDTAKKIFIGWGDGREEAFTNNGGKLVPETGIFDSLTQYQAGKYLLRTTDGTQFYFDNSTHKRLTKLLEPNGNFLSFGYTDSLITSITNSAGQIVTLNYSAGKLSSITDANATPVQTYTYAYDSYGNLIKVTDPMGGIIKYDYLVNGPISAMTDKNNNVADIIYYSDFSARELITCNSRTSFSYDSASRTTTVIDFVPTASNQTTTYVYNEKGWLTKLIGNCCGYNMAFAYDNNGNLLERKDANGNIYKYTYDNRGNYLTISDPLNNLTTYTYSSDFNQITGITDPLGNNYTVNYDAQGNPVRFVRPDGIQSSLTYSANGDLISAKDANNNIANIIYDAYGYPQKISLPLNVEVSGTFDGRGNVLSSKDANGNQYTVQYDSLNRVTKVNAPLGLVQTFGYDKESNLTSYTDAKGFKHQLFYDASNRIVSYKDPKGAMVSFTYDAMDNLIQYKDQLGKTSSLAYDNLNRLTSVTDAVGNGYSFSYDVVGNMISAVNPLGNSVHYTYDALNRIVSGSDDIGSFGSITYDKNGRVTSYTNATGAAVQFSYDNLNRVTRVTDPLGNSRAFTYDNNSNLLTQKDRNNHTSSYTFNTLNRVTSFTDNNGNIVRVQYDAIGNVTTLTDQNGNNTLYEYDALNRPVKMTYADGRNIAVTYDNDNNVTVAKLADGSVINYSYDSTNMMAATDLPNGEHYVFTYDAKHRLTAASNAAGMVTFAYDDIDRITSEMFTSHITSYNYNVPAKTMSTTYPNGTVVTKTFDKRGRLNSLSQNSQQLTSYQYNNINQLTQKNYSNGVVTNYAYDNSNRLSSISSNKNYLPSLSFQYDNEMNKTAVARTNDSQYSETFGYDANNRLINYKQGVLSGNSIASPLLQNSYTYDAVGNRVSANLNGVVTSYSVNNLNQLTKAGSTNFSYDGNGNQTYDGNFNMRYDALGRKLVDSVAGNIYRYQYDAFGRRIVKSVNGTATNFYYSGLEQIEERNSSDGVVATQVFQNFMSPLTRNYNNQKYFYHQNDLSSTEAITDSTGNLIERYKYEDFGKTSILNSSNNVIASSSIKNRFLYTGQEFDEHNNSYKFHFRNYNTATGSFNQRDPIGYGDGMGVYQYVGNNPGSFVDPLGLLRDPCAEQEAKEALREWKKKHGSNHESKEGHGGAEHGEGHGPGETFAHLTHQGHGAVQFFEAVGNIAKGEKAFEALAETGIAVSGAGEVIEHGGGLLGKAGHLLHGFGKFATGLGGTVNAIELVVYRHEGFSAKNVDRGFGAGLDFGALAKPGVFLLPAVGYGITNLGTKLATGGLNDGLSLPELSVFIASHDDVGVNRYVTAPGNLAGKIQGSNEAFNETIEIVAWQMKNNNLEKWKQARWLRDHRKEREEYYNSLYPVRNKPNCPQNSNPNGTQKPRPNPLKDPVGFLKWFMELITNHDPNLITGPDGVGKNKWVSINDRLPYQIQFENDTTATAPVKVVKVIYPIDPKQDINTFQLGSFGFNSLTFNIPDGANNYYQRLDARDSLGLLVDVTAGVDAVNRQAFWIFESIDPVTQLSTNDPLKGFLLTQDKNKPTSGNGFVNFSIKPISTAHTGDTISAIASIVFDANDTVPTNRAKNTIDALPPTTQLNSTVQIISPSTVKLSWHGKDDNGGSGLASYNLYVSSGNNQFSLNRSGITDTFSIFTGIPDSTYCFFITGKDSVNNEERISNNCDLSIKLSPSGCVIAAPVITVSGATTFCQGGSVILTTITTGTLQWFRDGVLISGATGQTYTATQSGSYTVRAGNVPCTATSTSIIITVTTTAVTPVITASGAISFCQGGNVTLSTTATATLQWLKDGVAISGATGQLYTATQGGSYAVRSGEGICTATSAAIVVSVTTAVPPTVTASGATTFCQGGSVILSTTSGGTLQWLKDGAIIAGATGQSYTATQSGSFTIRTVINSCTAISSAIVVSVNNSGVSPVITASGTTTFCQGGSVILTTITTGTLQWFKDGVLISGATGQSYTATQSGNYTLRSGVAGCTAISSAILVTVTALPATPVITTSGATTFCQGGNVILSTISTANLQWFKDGTIISGATGQSYTATQSGNYTVTTGVAPCVSTSASTLVTVSALPATPVITASGATTFCQGGTVILSTTSTANLQWLKDGTIIPGATGQTYTAILSGSYTVRATLASCTAASSAIVITVTPLPATPVITASGATTFCQGGNVILSTTSTSNLQWLKDGTIISGATGQSYTATQSGSYTVTTGVAPCTSTSASTQVTVSPLPATPVVTTSGVTTFCQGDSAVLTTASTANLQWLKNGTVISGATSQTYSATQSGSYSVRSGTASCTVTSSVIVITVNPIPVTPTVTATGATTFCQGDSVTLTSSSSSGNQWYKGGTVITGAINKVYIVNQPGIYTVLVTANNCTSAASLPMNVVVIATPAKPVVTVNLNTLTSSYTSGNQWYFSGAVIGGATNQQYVGTASGQYTVVAVQNGCTSQPSDVFNFTFIPNPDLLSIYTDVMIYPNPVKDNLVIYNKANRKLAIRIINMQGVVLYSGNIVGLTVTKSMVSIIPGSYFIEIKDIVTDQLFKKLIIKL